MADSAETVPSKPVLPRDFVKRRLHSLLGLWLVIYLILHLLTNSQAAFFIGDDGKGFIHSVNSIHDMPYLLLLEIFIIATPIVLHGWWGIQYIMTAKYNSFHTDGATPSLPEYKRNKAYTWQRLTSWVLLVGIILHVVHMRFIEYPEHAQKADQNYYIVRVDRDEGLYTLSARLGVDLLDRQQVEKEKTKTETLIDTGNFAAEALSLQQQSQQKDWLRALEKHKLNEDQVLAVSKNFGTADLLMLRNTFKNPIMIGLYTILVITACFHAFNGLWTFLIKWGIILKPRTQQIFLRFSMGLMMIVMFLGLAAVWGTYWVNLTE